MLINFPYIKRDSPIHRLDPRAKLVLMFAYSFAAAQTSNFWIILAGLIGAAFYYSQAHLKWRETRRVWIFIIFINLAIIFSNFLLSGGAIVQGVDISHQNILFYIPFIGLKPQFPF